MPVIRFEIRQRHPLAGGTRFHGPGGEVGPYEELKGRLSFAIDPLHPSNRRITDVGLAPRAASGRVEWSADVSILLPVDRTRCSGRVLLDVVNRGNTVAVPNFNRATRPVFTPGADPDPPVDVGDGFLMKRGWVVISCGWQGDVPAIPGLFRHADTRRATRGATAARPRLTRSFSRRLPSPQFLLSDRGHLPTRRPTSTSMSALLTVRDQPDGPATTIARERWRFARLEGGRVVPDATTSISRAASRRGGLYQITYTAEGAPVLGLSMAALRDSVSWLKHGTAADGNPAPGRSAGPTPTGAPRPGGCCARSIYEDVNLDEQGREALDGIIANVAGGMRGEFNQRFGQNSKDRNNMMAHLFPFTDQPATDPETGAKDALHARLDARGSRLRVFYTNTSAEYHRGDASLIHTDPDGTRDVAPGPNVRIYHFAGTEHGLGIWPPTDTQVAPADPTGPVDHSQHLRGIVDYSLLLRACLVHPRPLGGRRRRASTEPTPEHRRRHRRAAGAPRRRVRAHPRRLPAASRQATPARLDDACRPRRDAPSARSCRR